MFELRVGAARGATAGIECCSVQIEQLSYFIMTRLESWPPMT